MTPHKLKLDRPTHNLLVRTSLFAAAALSVIVAALVLLAFLLRSLTQGLELTRFSPWPYWSPLPLSVTMRSLPALVLFTLLMAFSPSMSNSKGVIFDSIPSNCFRSSQTTKALNLFSFETCFCSSPYFNRVYIQRTVDFEISFLNYAFLDIFKGFLFTPHTTDPLSHLDLLNNTKVSK